MENKKRLIDANATFELLRSLGSRDYRRDKGTIMDAMKMISHPEYTPTVDAVEVVRCKECEFSYEGLANLMCGRCGQTKGNLRLGGVSVAEDHFCGYGKRREKA